MCLSYTLGNLGDMLEKSMTVQQVIRDRYTWDMIVSAYLDLLVDRK